MDTKILIADDEPYILDALKIQLEVEGFKVITAEDGKDAFDKVVKHRPAVAILDVMMPKMNGFDVAKAIRHTEGISEMPIILITAKSNIEDKIEGFEMGADDFITKPYQFKELLARLRARLRASHIVKSQKILKTVTDKEQELNEAMQIESALTSSKIGLVSNLIHEMKTPLANIIGYSEILADSHIENDRISRQLNLIEASARHIFQIISDVMDLLHFDGENTTLSNSDFHYKDTLDSVIYLMGMDAYKKNISLIALSDHAVDLIYSDAVKLRQVLINLISNAIKYTPNGGKITVTSKLAGDGKHLSISVADTGVGISPEDEANLFKPFPKAASPYTRGQRQVGFGLVISKKLVEMLGGDITYESTVGKGSTFTFTILTK
jgi:signal transduction histidine kinase